MRAYATVSPTPPEIERLPLAGVHLSGLAAVVSVHITILSAPLKQASLTRAVPSVSVVLPLQGAPDVIEKPPSGPHELIVVGGTWGCGATWRHPAAVSPAAAATAKSANLLTNANLFANATIATLPRIRPTSQARLVTIAGSPGPRILSFYPLAAMMSRPSFGL
jgi:hypothetical protein